MATALVLFLFQFTACSSFFDKDNTPAPNALVTIQPVISPKIIWKTQTNARVDQSHLRMGLINDSQYLYLAGSNGIITALDSTNGKILWQTQLGYSLASTPAVYADKIIVTTQNGFVFALATSNANVLWQTNLKSPILASAAINDKIVIVKTLDGNTFGLNLENGSTLWNFQQIEPNMILRGSSAPVLHQNSAYVGFANGNLAKLNIQNGMPVWIQNIAVPEGAFTIQRMIDIDADPVLIRNHLFVATYQGNVANLNIENGRFIWQQKMSSYTGMAIDDSQLFISDANSYLYAFSSQTGQQQWENRDLFARNITAPAQINNFIVVGDKEGYLHWLDKRTGKFVARTQIGGAITSAPLVINQKIIVLDSKGRVIAFKIENN